MRPHITTISNMPRTGGPAPPNSRTATDPRQHVRPCAHCCMTTSNIAVCTWLRADTNFERCTAGAHTSIIFCLIFHAINNKKQLLHHQRMKPTRSYRTPQIDNTSGSRITLGTRFPPTSSDVIKFMK